MTTVELVFNGFWILQPTPFQPAVQQIKERLLRLH
jgi:hypothetical protein